MRKWVYLLSVLMCLAILGGCGKKDGETSQETVKQNKDYVYSFESFNEKLEGHDLSQNIILQDRMIFIEYRYEDVAPQAREEGAVMEEVPVEEIVDCLSAEEPKMCGLIEAQCGAMRKKIEYYTALLRRSQQNMIPIVEFGGAQKGVDHHQPLVHTLTSCMFV